MRTRELRALLRLCREFGVTRIKTPDVELELGNASDPLIRRGLSKDNETTEQVAYTTSEPRDPLEDLFYHEAVKAGA